MPRATRAVSSPPRGGPDLEKHLLGLGHDAGAEVEASQVELEAHRSIIRKRTAERLGYLLTLGEREKRLTLGQLRDRTR